MSSADLSALAGDAAVRAAVGADAITVVDDVARAAHPLYAHAVRELLPAEYAYTLPAGALRALRRGRYSFRAVARSPRGGEPAIAVSEPFER